MKTKNMRKKALLSSVAMLLVAVVALGGATYAWFSTNAATTASGMQMTTSAESTLLFAPTGTSVDADAWQTSYTLNATVDPVTEEVVQAAATQLSPVSSLTGEEFVAIAGSGGGTVEQQLQSKVLSISPKSIANGAAYQESFLCKTTATNTNVYVSSITSGDSTLKPAMRIAIKITGSADNTNNAAKVFTIGNTSRSTMALTQADGETYVPADSDYTTFEDLYTYQATADNSIPGIDRTPQVITTAGTQAAIINTDTALTPNTAYTITITVWLEGNDSACNNSFMNQNISDFTINFTSTQPQS